MFRDIVVLATRVTVHECTRRVRACAAKPDSPRFHLEYPERKEKRFVLCMRCHYRIYVLSLSFAYFWFGGTFFVSMFCPSSCVVVFIDKCVAPDDICSCVVCSVFVRGKSGFVNGWMGGFRIRSFCFLCKRIPWFRLWCNRASGRNALRRFCTVCSGRAVVVAFTDRRDQRSRRCRAVR